MIRRILLALVVLCGLLFAKAAHADNFRHGTLTWTVPDPVTAPLTVEFTVTTTWRAAALGTTTLFFGDGTSNPPTQGAVFNTGVDLLNQAHTTTRYVVSHTYALPGDYLAFFEGFGRIAGLVNGALQSYRVDSQVAVFPGVTASPESTAAVIIRQQLGAIRTHKFTTLGPVTCRFATTAEMWSQNPGDPPPPPATQNIPTVPAGGAMPTLVGVADGCVMTWDLTQALPGQQYMVHIILERVVAGHNTTSTIDLIDEIIGTAPLCAGSGSFTVNIGQAFSHGTTGTNNLGTALTVTASGMPAGATLTPPSGSSGATPLSSTFDWTPAPADGGTTATVLVTYTNIQNASTSCTLTIQVEQCPGFGAACTSGVGACQTAGTNVCTAQNTATCNAVPGSASPEICDGIDNDCNGVVDNGIAGVGVACGTGLLGVCSAGTTACVGAAVACVQNVASSAETCDGLDNDCNGQSDEGSPGSGAACSTGLLGVCSAGTTACTGGAITCNQNQASSNEICDGLDNNCNGTSDEGNPGGGAVCATGLQGVCSAGTTACTAGAVACVQNVASSAETCDSLDNDCDGTADDGNPGGGAACATGLLGACAAGTTACTGGSIACNQNVQSVAEICGDLVDNDCDGAIDDGCAAPDTDGDGLPDAVELLIGTNPNDGDSDDDGVPDGQEPSPGVDTDGDGLINALDPDSDNDGLLDGTEMGFDCNDPATDLTKNRCVPDGDLGATKTDPLNADTDGGGASDGSEDSNLNGVIDGTETNPTLTHGGDDATVVDTDGDGLSDPLELALGTNPNDADSDDDGVPDGLEPNPSLDDDGDGLIHALDPDSDNDGLVDGTEMGFDCSNPATDLTQKHCVPDGDLGATKTSPLDPDTDDGGVNDGSEDSNLNGVLDAGETDPTVGHGTDDQLVVDTDGDGLSDALEATIGTEPDDADSDDDGVPDGIEPNPSIDMDGDGLIDALDPDSDGDGLFDGTEMGFDCDDPATDTTKNLCIPDGDLGATKTSPLDPDTDDGGIEDGDEDLDHDGVVDSGEKDPNVAADDVVVVGCDMDSDCGAIDSGKVCDDTTHMCIDGGRGMGGNGCPSALVCTSSDTTIGQCVECNTDSECGAIDSGKVCDNSTHTCIDGCRGKGGNGCPESQVCSSDDESIGTCSGCRTDSDCGGPKSGKICNLLASICDDGCRPEGEDGNGCPDGKVCDVEAGDDSGSCVTDDGVIAQGNGIFCATRPANDNGNGNGALWLAGVAALALARRRRRAS